MHRNTSDICIIKFVPKEGLQRRPANPLENCPHRDRQRDGWAWVNGRADGWTDVMRRAAAAVDGFRSGTSQILSYFHKESGLILESQ